MNLFFVRLHTNESILFLILGEDRYADEKGFVALAVGCDIGLTAQTIRIRERAPLSRKRVRKGAEFSRVVDNSWEHLVGRICARGLTGHEQTRRMGEKRVLQ